MLNQSGVNMSGKPESSTLTLQADGEEREVSPQAPGILVATRWIGTHRLDTVARRGADTIGCGTYEVSADGRTTATVSGIDAQMPSSR